MSATTASTRKVSALTCSKCSRSFNSRTALAQHSIQRNHGSDRCCHECLKLFGSSEALEAHKNNSPAHFKPPGTFIKAVAFTKTPISTEAVHTSSLRCSLCNRTFGSSEALGAHNKYSTAHLKPRGNPTQAVAHTKPSASTDSVQTASLKCTVCNRTFGSSEALKAHKKDSPAHIKAPDTPAKPIGPIKPLTAAGSVQTPPHKFAVCGQTYPTKTALTDHRLITEHEIDLCCVPCCRHFGSKDDLEQRKNSGRKPPFPTEGDALQCRGNVYTTIPSDSHAKVLKDLESLCHSRNTLLRHRFTLEAGSGSLPTPASHPSSPKRKAIVLDCEMSGVKGGKSEVVFLMAIDFLTGQELVNTLVKPSQPIVEWRSDIHGITPGRMAVARAANRALEGVEAARAELWRFMDGDTVLVGQSVNNDLDCLRIVHKTVVDTAVLASDAVFGAGGTPKYWGLGLKDLCRELLDIKIREDSRSGTSMHDSLEDVLVPREVVLWILEHEEDFSVWANKRGQVSRKQHFGKKKGKKQKVRRSTSYHREEEVAWDDDSDEQIRFRDVIDYDMWPKSPDEW